MSSWRNKPPDAQAPPQDSSPDLIRSPVFQPDPTLDRWLFHCPICDDDKLCVNDVIVEMGGFDLRPHGRVVLRINGHGDAACRHLFRVILTLSDGGVQCVVDIPAEPPTTV